MEFELQFDSDIQDIIQRYTIDCVKLLEKNISDKVLHAVEENKKLKEEIAELKKQIENRESTTNTVVHNLPTQGIINSCNSSIFYNLMQQSMCQSYSSLHSQLNSPLLFHSYCNYGDHK